MINKKIIDITGEIGNTIIVLKGFNNLELPKENKYFSFNIEFYDKVDYSALREKVIDEIIDNRKFDTQYKWMTIEEYQLFKSQSNISKMPIVALENNLYDKQFPYRDTLSDVENIYQYLYYQEDNELEVSQQKALENVSIFYGQIDYSKLSENYYVTYPEFEDDIKIFKLYDEQSIEVIIDENYPIENVMKIELSDNELLFLDLEFDIINGKNDRNIVFVLSRSVDSLPYNYLVRLNILKRFTTFNMYFTTPYMSRNVIENENEYLKILGEVYGYEKFRYIKFYKNIESLSKDTIAISQAQIIDDIVIQAEKAINGDPFRDIYVTSSTGSGKSVMFQIPALYLAKKYTLNKPLTLIITPLIGLMNDQVENMRNKGVFSTATINGNTPPYEKENILNKVHNKEVDVLYLSPETLQARSDIKYLIGDREIGIVIIDEAHIVTTWGKSFRADYWYLGIYLAKLRKKYKFPIVTFTATAIYGGKEDMYLDTRNSLNMISPISYFGEVRRDDILLVVRGSEKNFDAEGRDYRKTKNVLALKHLKKASIKSQKSLIYFPTVKLLLDFYNFIYQNDTVLASKTGKYYGTLKKEEKDEVLREFKTGELRYVLATKAFGMGIDIPDITNVYHYAPTGNVVDYIQEIGRVARDKSKVKYGFGMIDFLSRDMNEVKQLYGMSAIKKSQIIEVMRKVLAIYKEKGNNRNLIISPEDFKYIFIQNKRDEDSLDNKVKTVLLMIEKDFSSPNKLGYSPFVARPRSLYGNDLIFVTTEFEIIIHKSSLSNYFCKKFDLNSNSYCGIYQVNLSAIWEKYYRKMTFPNFKRCLFEPAEREKLKHSELFKKFVYTSGIEVAVASGISNEKIFAEYRVILQVYEDFINDQKISGNQFTVVDLGNYIMKRLKITDKFQSRSFAQTIINASFEFGKLKEIKFITERLNSNSENQRYIIHQDGDLFTRFIMSSINSALSPTDNYSKELTTITSFHFRFGNDDLDSKIAALGIGEARNLLSFQVIGGNNPQIYLRMNSVFPLEKAIKQGNFYQNNILNDIQGRYYTSVEMLKYLFAKEQTESLAKDRITNYTKWFWDNIENYFMGIIPNEVKAAITKK